MSTKTYPSVLACSAAGHVADLVADLTRAESDTTGLYAGWARGSIAKARAKLDEIEAALDAAGPDAQARGVAA
jgi:hypothetical protein